MESIRRELIYAAINNVDALIDEADENIRNNTEKQYEFKKNIILADEFLTKIEKLEAIKELNMTFDYYNVLYKKGPKELVKIAKTNVLLNSIVKSVF
jgi:hypothetical protein